MQKRNLPKKIRPPKAVPTSTLACQQPLPRLPDCLWLRILSYVSAEDALQLVTAAESGLPVLRRVAADRSLWRQVRANLSGRRTAGELRRIVKYLHRGTASFTLVGDANKKKKKDRKKASVSDAFLSSLWLRCPSLRHLGLERVVLGRLTLRSLPTGLKSLSLAGSCFGEDFPTDKSRAVSPLKVVALRQQHLEVVRSPQSYEYTVALYISPFRVFQLDLRGCKSWMLPCDRAAAKGIKSIEVLFLE